MKLKDLFESIFTITAVAYYIIITFVWCEYESVSV